MEMNTPSSEVIEKQKAILSDFLTQHNDITLDAIEFENCIFEEPFKLPMQFVCKKPVFFTDCDFSTIRLDLCSFTQSIYFYNCRITEDLTILRCSFMGQFRIEALKARSINFLSSTFKSDCLLDYDCKDDAKLYIDEVGGEVYISQAKSESTSRMKKTEIIFLGIYEQITIENINSDSVHLRFSEKYSTTELLKISMINAEEFLVANLRNNAGNKVLMEFISANNISFGSIHNDGVLVLRYFEPESVAHSGKFHLGNSYLGNCDLYHVDFAAYSTITIFDCHLLKIMAANVKWNFRIKAYTPVENESLREPCRQLKNVCANNMDKIAQLQFERMEMHFYDKQLHWRKDFGDWIILKSNKYSNNYGQNWVLPLLWLFAIGFILYTTLNYCNGNFNCYHIGNYLNFVMPFHNLKEVLCDTGNSFKNNWVGFWDIFQRIISSYLIFQFLRAFRKYVI